MRVLQLIDRLLPTGGAERLQLVFARAVADRELESAIATLGANDPSFRRAVESAGTRVVPFPAPFVADPRRVYRLARFIRRESVDLVHAHLVRSTVVGALACRLARVPLVVTLHNSRRSQRLPMWLRRAELAVLRSPRVTLLACGWETAEAHRPQVQPSSITVVPNAVSPAPAVSERRRDAIRGEFEIPERAPLAIAVGRLHEQKGFADLLEAHARLLRLQPDAFLVIVGEGEQRAALEARIAERDLAARVRLAGVRDDVRELLAASDLFVSSSHWEGLPVAMLEAMAAALPIVATRVGDVVRIADERSARLVEAGHPEQLAEAMAKLLADRGLARSLGENGRRRVEWDFGTESWIDRHLEIYAAALES